MIITNDDEHDDHDDDDRDDDDDDDDIHCHFTYQVVDNLVTTFTHIECTKFIDHHHNHHHNHHQTIFAFLLLAAFVAAVPADESLPGDLYDDQDLYSAQNPQSFFKLKKIKKILLG
ncbi:hypothetical protein DOY81_005341 [Sarcophaga bullata]|nr:hypothetical protein DOY81_005341 [Sarcophaga bullata]